MGIIPARAGFTYQWVEDNTLGSDHPRSRGVYYQIVITVLIGTGSSPLARGLRGDVEDEGLEDRIIPARAGFTLYRYKPRARAKDHPRSRGVYDSQSATGSHAQGSSPLARGLRRAGRGSPVLLRIIPARAGFTGVPRRPPHPRGDHPRSRGVYPTSVNHHSSVSGSSPLARGLRSGSVFRVSF